MLIELSKDVFWDTESEIQTEECNEWIREHVYQYLGMNPNDKGSDVLQPEYDEYKRPYKWVTGADDWELTVIRIYIEDSASWAMKKDKINVIKK